MSDKIWFLKQCDIFERLSVEEFSLLESRCRAREFPRGTPVFLPSDESQAVLLLARGRVKVCNLTADGKQAILTFIEPGEIFGELAIFDEGKREDYAEAVEESMIVLIPADEINRLMQAHPDVALGVTKLIGFRRRRVERRLKSLLFQSNRQRLVHLLLDLAGQYGTPTVQGTLLGIKLSHQDLANIIGSTRETVTVVLGELQAEGKVILGRRRIVLTAPHRLAESVGKPAAELAVPH